MNRRLATHLAVLAIGVTAGVGAVAWILAMGAMAAADVRALQVDRVARLSPHRQIIGVKGAIVCSSGGLAYVRVGVTQAWIHGDGWTTSIACDGRTHRWNAPVEARKGRFHTGRASASAEGTRFDPEGRVAGGVAGRDLTIQIATARH